LASLFAHAHAVIVGSAIKQGGVWSNDLCPERMRAIVAARDAIR
jgi:predicted TIM-barrel enzyme